MSGLGEGIISTTRNDYIYFPGQTSTCGSPRGWWPGWGSGPRSSGCSGTGGRLTRGPPARRSRGGRTPSGGRPTDNSHLPLLLCDVRIIFNVIYTLYNLLIFWSSPSCSRTVKNLSVF